MYGLIILLVTLLVGKQLAAVLPGKWYKLEFWSIAYILGLLLTTWAIFLFSLFFGYAVGIPVALLTVGVGSYFLQKKLRSLSHVEFAPLTKSLRVALVVYLIFWGALLWSLFSTRLFIEQPDGWYSGGTTWADLAMHSTLIYSFAEHTTVDLTSPLFSTQNTTYPFLFDFYTAMLLKTGLTIQESLIITSMLTGLALVILFFFLLLRVTKSLFIALLGSSLFFFNSNIGTLYFFKEWRASGMGLLEFTKNLTSNYVHYPDHFLDWPQYMTDYLLPQRGIMVGLSVFLIICYLLHFLLQEKKLERIYIYVLSFCIGLMPFFHVHTFFVLIGVTGWFVLLSLFKKQTHVKDWLIPSGIIVALAAPQLHWQFSQTYTDGFTHFKNGWYYEGSEFFLYWMRNLGLEFFSGIAGIIYLYYTKKTPQLLRLIIFPLTVLFLICNFVIFQPNDWDNTKFMIYSHFGFIVISLFILERVQRAHKFFAPVVGLIIFFMTVGGALSVIRELQTNWISVTNEEVDMAKEIREKTEPGAVFLTADTHNHPIPMLTGRPLVMGYRGWLWTYGIDYRPVEADVFSMYRGDPVARELFKKYNVQYVYIGWREVVDFKANEEYFKQFPLIYTSERMRIYKVQ